VRPEEYLLIILRRWWVVVLAVVIAAGSAYVYSARQEPTYQASTRLMAIAEPPDYWLDLYAKNRLASYRALIGNWDFVSQALADAGVDADPGHAMGALALNHSPDSNVVQVVVTDTDPDRAAAIANALAGGFVRHVERENETLSQIYTGSGNNPLGTVHVVQLESPGPPDTPIGPRVRLNTAAAALLGLTFGILLAFVAFYFEDTLRTTAEVERYLELPTIASIPRR
jgi:capsular polysaccharide biosynthesis protein